MARYTVSADSLEELAEALAEITGGEAPAASEGAPTKRPRRKKSEAPDPVTPTATPDANAAAAGFNPGAANPGAATAANAGFNPGAANGAAPGPGFNPGAAAAGPAVSETMAKVKAHIAGLATQHGETNVYGWVKTMVPGADANATPEQVRDVIIPSLPDNVLMDIYAKSGGK